MQNEVILSPESQAIMEQLKLARQAQAGFTSFNLVEALSFAKGIKGAVGTSWADTFRAPEKKAPASTGFGAHAAGATEHLRQIGHAMENIEITGPGQNQLDQTPMSSDWSIGGM